MKRLLNYLPLHFIVFVIIGICFQFFTNFWHFGFFKLLLILSLFTLFLWFIKNKIVTTISIFIIFFFIGVSSIYFNDSRNYDSFYKNHLQDNSTTILQIRKILKPGIYHHKYEANIIQIDKNKTVGKILLNIEKDSLTHFVLNVDDKIISKNSLQEVKSSLNPNQFNYKLYLEKQGIYQQIYLKNNQYLFLESTSNSLLGLSDAVRKHIQKSLKKHHFKDDELTVIKALLLGQRQDISKELISDYQNAGAIHILAVSGLHVGVILLVLTFLCKPLERLKNGKILKTGIIILLLWMFAFIAGLSASVVRAVTMFTFIAIGMSFKRKKVVEFSLISSMFFLLIIKPMFLFDVGFQLSYLAVFGIIWVQPKLYAIWEPKNKVLRFFWGLFTVSIAAQLGVLPLSIYYFQQLPGLFLTSNLVIIPCLIYILVGGILVILTSVLNILPQFLADMYATFISWMNSFISFISHQEEFIFKEIAISIFMMISLYVLIVFGVRFFSNKTSKKFLYFLASILIIQGIFLFEKKQQQSKKELLIFHKSRFSVIGKRVGEHLFLQHNLDSLKVKSDYSLKSYRISEHIKDIKKTNFKNYIQFAKKEILIIDSLDIYNLKGLENPIILLKYSPKINLERLIKTIKPSQIIADGSNYKSYVIRWENSCLKSKIPFYYTGENGAYILKE
ncbi:MAG: ComEC/Rec2 family competence protein [Polaribacter sp.]